MYRKQNKSVSQFGKNVGLGLQCFYIESIYVAVIDLRFSCVAFGYALFYFRRSEYEKLWLFRNYNYGGNNSRIWIQIKCGVYMAMCDYVIIDSVKKDSITEEIYTTAISNYVVEKTNAENY